MNRPFSILVQQQSAATAARRPAAVQASGVGVRMTPWGQRWRRWLPGPKYGLARGTMVYGHPLPPGPQVLRDLLGRCDRLQDWARLQGFGPEPVPEDLALLDEAIDRVIAEHGRHTRMSAVGNEAGQFLGTVIVSAVDGAHWRLWPNGHPVVRLPSSRDLDVIALAHDRVDRGQPRLAEVYADAASSRAR